MERSNRHQGTAVARRGHTAANSREACDLLREALEDAGITLPSMTPDYATLTVEGMVDLGRVRPEVALLLAAVVRKGAER